MQHGFNIRSALMLAIAMLALCSVAQQPGDSAPAEASTASRIVRLMPESDCVKLSEGMPQADSLLSFCEWVLTFRERLPNILADEKMDRAYLEPGRWRPRDTITMTAHYSGGRVEYTGLAINGRPTNKSIFELSGAWSTGELGAVLEGMIADVRTSRFKFDKKVKGEAGQRLLSYKFTVSRTENGSWVLASGGDRRFIPGYKGSLLIEEGTGRCVEFERVTTDVDSKFPLQIVKMRIRYDDVRLADRSHFVLPVYSESYSCNKQVRPNEYEDCAKVELTFHHWRKFGAEHRILPEATTLPPN